MEEKLPASIAEQLLQFATNTKEGQLLLQGYFIGKGFTPEAKVKLKAEFTVIVENNE